MRINRGRREKDRNKTDKQADVQTEQTFRQTKGHSCLITHEQKELMKKRKTKKKRNKEPKEAKNG